MEEQSEDFGAFFDQLWAQEKEKQEVVEILDIETLPIIFEDAEETVFKEIEDNEEEKVQEKRVACEECGSLVLDLGKHVARSHRKKYQCEKCQKWFGLKFTLKVHMRSHSDHRVRLHCDICTKTFTT